MKACKPLILFYNGLGDAVMALPALRAMASSFAHPLTILTNREAPVFQLLLNEVVGIHFLFTDVEETNEGGKVFPVEDLKNVMKEFDVLICLNEWYPEPAQEYIQLIEDFNTSIGCFSFFRHPVKRRSQLNTFDFFFEFAKLVHPDLHIDRFSFPPQVSEKHQSIIRSFKSSLPAGSRLLSIHTDTQRTKMWPEEKFAELIAAILCDYAEYCVVVVGTAIPAFHELEEESRFLKLENNDFRTSWALIAQSDSFIGVDSVFLHLADIHRVPTVALFGPTSSDEWGCRFTPVFEHVNALGRVMEEISVQQVIDKFQDITLHYSNE